MHTHQKRAEKLATLNTSLEKLSNEQANKLTKECIQSALLELMKNTPFDKITITDIVKHSGVSRMAFYRNFDSKRAILSDMADILFGELYLILADYRQHQTSLTCYQAIFELFCKYQENIHILLHGGIHISDFLVHTEVFSKCYIDVDFRIRYKDLSWWGALDSIVIDWFEQGMKESVEEMIHVCNDILPQIPIVPIF